MPEGCWEPEAFCYGKEGRHFESGRKGFKLSIEGMETVLQLLISELAALVRDFWLALARHPVKR